MSSRHALVALRSVSTVEGPGERPGEPRRLEFQFTREE
jgi:hypothetical protein